MKVNSYLLICFFQQCQDDQHKSGCFERSSVSLRDSGALAISSSNLSRSKDY